MKASGEPTPGGARDARARGARGLRREEILTAAAALFARRGFHGVTIDDIGAAAGLSGPGIYRHFPGKEAMLSEMLLGISQRLLAEGSRRVGDDIGHVSHHLPYSRSVPRVMLTDTNIDV